MSSSWVTAPMVLPDDVLIVPVLELSAETRERLAAADDDFAITRRYARAPSKVVSRDPASLLEIFRTPVPIAEAVARFAAERESDAQDLLRESYAFLRACVSARILVRADSPLADRIVPIYGPGDDIDSMEVIRCVKLLDDTEVYQVRSGGATLAVKILRPECSGWTAEALAREASILAGLNGGVAPELVSRGSWGGRAYLALEWCAGVPPGVVADEARAEAAPVADERLLEIGRSILQAYARLHAEGVVHGDVHPGNLLVDGAGRTRVLDFGFAVRSGGQEKPAPRGGTTYYLDPRYAAARRTGTRPEAANPQAEQYSVAAVLYRVVTGGYTHDFPLDADGILRLISEEPPLVFPRRGARPWPQVEEALGRALSKNPEGRFPSMGAFLESWSAIPPRTAGDHGPMRGRRSGLTETRDAVLARLKVGGPLWSRGLGRAPTCSVSAGGAGIAYALYRMACTTDSAVLLAEADQWLARAEQEMHDEDAFYDGEKLTPERLGTSSPYHTRSGVHAVRVLLGLAAGDHDSARRAARRFVEAGASEPGEMDLWLGRAGTLLACANLLPPLECAGLDGSGIRSLGDRLHRDLETWTSTLGPVCDCPGLSNYGVAHGWAGLLYTALRWGRVTGRPPAGWVGPRLEQLADCGEPYGRGVRWAWRDRVPEAGRSATYGAGWCNGSAGFVHLWTLASSVLDREDFMDLAVRAGWHAWEGTGTLAHLCCGLAGRAYASFHLYARTGDVAWRQRGLALADRALSVLPELRAGADARYADAGLYRGDLGVALLISELDEPETACMPFFADEGWPSPTAA